MLNATQFCWSLFALVNLLSPGDTLSGFSHFEDCLRLDDAPMSIVVSEAQGNAFSGHLVSMVGDKIRDTPVRGFVYVPGRQLIITSTTNEVIALGLLCTGNKDNDNDFDCKIMANGFTKSCGSAGLKRDRTSEFCLGWSWGCFRISGLKCGFSLSSFPVQFLSEGDTFTGTVSMNECLDVNDFPAAVVITRSAGNALQARVVGKVGAQV